MDPKPLDQYEVADLIEKVSDRIAEDEPLQAIDAIAEAFALDLVDEVTSRG